MLVAVLKVLENECKAGVLLPALHFECHGDKQKGLWLATSNEYVSWSDLARLIAPLNAATRNNLIVVLASCHGFTLWRSVNIKDPCPFHFMIAPNKEISTGAIYDSILPFYKVVMETGELQFALTHLDTKFQRFIAGEWFYSIIAVFFADSYSSKVRAKMVEQIVSNEVAKVGYDNWQFVRAIRARAKKHLASPKNFYKRIENNFFHGQMHVPFLDIQRFVGCQKSKR